MHLGDQKCHWLFPPSAMVTPSVGHDAAILAFILPCHRGEHEIWSILTTSCNLQNNVSVHGRARARACFDDVQRLRLNVIEGIRIIQDAHVMGTG